MIYGPHFSLYTQPTTASSSGDCHDPETIDIYRQEWTTVFIIAAEVYVFGAIVYLLLGSGKKQSWADGYDHDSSMEFEHTSRSIAKKTNFNGSITNNINSSTNIQQYIVTHCMYVNDLQ